MGSITLNDIAYGVTGQNGLAQANFQEIEDYINGKGGGLVTLAENITVHLRNGDAKSNIYTVPVGKKMIVSDVVIRTPTDSLAGGTDFNFGDGAACTTWRQTVDLADLTLVSHYRIISSNDVTYTIFDAGDVFGIIPVIGAVADADAKADLFGYLYDA